MNRKILVLGSSNVDLILRIPRFHHPGETIISKNLITAYGGKGANQAIAAKRLGGKVIFITKLGNDQFGKFYRRYLIQNGLAPEYLLAAPKIPTGVALIELTLEGENRIIVSPGANESLSIRDLKALPQVWKGVGVFVTQLEIPLPTVKSALRMAKDHSALTLLNPSPIIPLPSEILSLVDFLVPNEGEAERLTGIRMRSGKDLAKMADRLLTKGVKNVVVTLGAQGLFFKNRDGEFWMDVFPVKAVDTTAAGDAFMGALAFGLAGGMPIRKVLRWASAAGALAATKLGAQPSLPKKKELRKFLVGKRDILVINPKA